MRHPETVIADHNSQKRSWSAASSHLGGFRGAAVGRNVNRMPIYEQLAVRYHKSLPERVRQYLNNVRGISDAVIDKYELGWDGQRIAIPIRDRSGNVSFFKLAKAPDDTSDGPKMKASLGARAELYGWDRALAHLDQVVVCEGEFDRLALESRGYAAVTSTAGALTFRKEWADALAAITGIYLCFDRDAAGEAGARRVAWLLPHAKIVALPPEVGPSGDVTDFFVGLGRTIEDFDALLAQAQPLSEHERLQFQPSGKPGAKPFVRSEAADLKAQVRIEDWIAPCLTLEVQGRNFVAHCPFHEDAKPSFVVFPATQTFYCFGCRVHGDVFTFLMRIRGINFAEACAVVRRSTQDDGQDAA